jgi:ribosomal protein L28
MQQRRYFVARPVTQTVERTEKYTVLRPVYKMEMRDASYNRVRNVVETRHHQETYNVSRPVYTTETQQRRRRVREYVNQTVNRDVQQVRFQPVTTYTTKYVDRGQYVSRQVQVQRNRGYGLHWVPGGWGPDPATGKQRYEIPGLAWLPKRTESKTVNRRTWQPNMVAKQIPHKTMRRVAYTTKVPTQAGRWVEREVVENVPVRVMKTVTEQKTRTVPFTTTRRVVERVERQIPVRTCEWVREEHTRKVPVTYTRLMYEERIDQVPVRCCKLVAVEEIVQRARLVPTFVPAAGQCCVPLTQIIQVPCGGCATGVGSVEVATPSATRLEPIPADEGNNNSGIETPNPTLPPDHHGWYPRGTRS